MISVFRLILLLITASTILMYSFFWSSFLTQQKETISFLADTIQNDMGEITYNLSKETSSLSDIAKYRSILDRKAATNDIISSIYILNNNSVLLTTLPFQSNPELNLENMTEVKTAKTREIFKKASLYTEFRIYDQATPIRLHLVLHLNKAHIQQHLDKGLHKLIYTKGLSTVGILLPLWWILIRTLTNPKLRIQQYQYLAGLNVLCLFIVWFLFKSHA